MVHRVANRLRDNLQTRLSFRRKRSRHKNESKDKFRKAKFETLSYTLIWCQITTPWAKAVDMQQCAGLAHLRAELESVEAKGGEGLMLRQPKSFYAHGTRSGTLLKVNIYIYKCMTACTLVSLTGEIEHSFLFISGKVIS